MPKIIKTLAEFKRLANRPMGVEYYILLNGGLRSSKFCIRCYRRLKGKEKIFYINNYIDSIEERLTLEEFKQTNTYKALLKGCLYLD